MLKGFREFIRRGNVVDLAVGVVIGAAFTGLVTQFGNSFLKPLIQVITAEASGLRNGSRDVFRFHGRSAIFTPVARANAIIPMNNETAMTPSIRSVVAALRDLGFRNAGTPLLIASTPVSAAEPDENALATRNTSANPRTSPCSERISKPADSARR